MPAAIVVMSDADETMSRMEVYVHAPRQETFPE